MLRDRYHDDNIPGGLLYYMKAGHMQGLPAEPHENRGEREGGGRERGRGGRERGGRERGRGSRRGGGRERGKERWRGGRAQLKLLCLSPNSGLLMARNMVAGHYGNLADHMTLPGMLKDSHVCKHCPYQAQCCLVHKYVPHTETSHDTNSDQNIWNAVVMCVVL